MPEGDVVVHAGDVTSSGSRYEVMQFLDWFTELDYDYKVFIAGNHDWFFEKEESHELVPDNIIYLNDSGAMVQDKYFWGSPVQPTFHNWAFNRERGDEINEHWNLIPNTVDVLITHGPPLVLDITTRGDEVGCHDLQEAIDRVNPILHVFGHIHESYGIVRDIETTYINASQLDERYQLANKPIVFEL